MRPSRGGWSNDERCDQPGPGEGAISSPKATRWGVGLVLMAVVPSIAVGEALVSGDGGLEESGEPMGGEEVKEKPLEMVELPMYSSAGGAIVLGLKNSLAS